MVEFAAHGRGRQAVTTSDTLVPILVLDPGANSVWLENTEIKLTRKAYQIFVFLVENRSRFVSREEILQGAWPDTVVTPESVKDYIATIRKALADPAQSPRYIETRRHKGYRFIGKVEAASGSHKTAVVSSSMTGGLNLVAGTALIDEAKSSMEGRTPDGYFEAIACLNQAREVGCCRLELSLALARLHLIAHICALESGEDNHLEQALINASFAYGKMPKNANTTAVFASALAYNHEYEVAHSLFGRAIELDGKNRRVLEYYASYLCQIGEVASAENILSSIAGGNTRNQSSVSWMRASNMFQLKKYAAAKMLMARHIEVFPRSIRPLHGFAAILAMAGERQQADHVIQRLIELQSDLSLTNEYSYQAGYYRNEQEVQQWVDAFTIAGIR